MALPITMIEIEFAGTQQDAFGGTFDLYTVFGAEELGIADASTVSLKTLKEKGIDKYIPPKNKTVIPVVIVEKKHSDNGIFCQEWVEVFSIIGNAVRRARELNQQWIQRRKFEYRARFELRNSVDIIGTCSICGEPVFDGDEFDNPNGDFDYPVHEWCPKEVDRPMDINPTTREARGL